MLNIKYGAQRPFLKRSPLQSRALFLSHEHAALGIHHGASYEVFSHQMDVASSAVHVLQGTASHISHRPLYYNKQFNLTLQPFSPVRLLCCYLTSATTRSQCSPLSLRIPVQSLSSSTSYRGWPVEHTSKMLIPCSQCLFQFMTKGVSSRPSQRKRVRGMESRS